MVAQDTAAFMARALAAARRWVPPCVEDDVIDWAYVLAQTSTSAARHASLLELLSLCLRGFSLERLTEMPRLLGLLSADLANGFAQRAWAEARDAHLRRIARVAGDYAARSGPLSAILDASWHCEAAGQLVGGLRELENFYDGFYGTFVTVFADLSETFSLLLRNSDHEISVIVSLAGALSLQVMVGTAVTSAAKRRAAAQTLQDWMSTSARALHVAAAARDFGVEDDLGADEQGAVYASLAMDAREHQATAAFELSAVLRAAAALVLRRVVSLRDRGSAGRREGAGDAHDHARRRARQSRPQSGGLPAMARACRARRAADGRSIAAPALAAPELPRPRALAAMGRPAGGHGHVRQRQDDAPPADRGRSSGRRLAGRSPRRHAAGRRSRARRRALHHSAHGGSALRPHRPSRSPTWAPTTAP